MPAPDPSEPVPPQRPKSPRRDPRLDAKPPARGPLPAPTDRATAKPPVTPPTKPIVTPPDKAAVTPAATSRPTPAVDVETTSAAAKPRPNMLVWLMSGVSVVILIGVAGWVLFANKNRPGTLVDVGNTGKQAQGPKADQANVSELREPQKPVNCRIKTPEPGFVAFVDDQPVRDELGKILLTPCEVALEKGRHSIRVAKKGWNDIPRTVDVTEAIDFNQEPTYEPFAETSTTFTAPYLEAAVGQPVLLKPLVFKGRCQDPFVSINGREIWYAASGPEGMGIYYSSRATPYDEWDTPSLLVLSRGADLPASPSAKEDGLLVSYTVPGKVGRVWGLSRKSPEESFDDKKPLHYLEHGEAEWPTAQLSADGLKLYWIESRAEKSTSWIATRSEARGEFGDPRKLVLPGGHPCLSADELRQYLFDGKQLSRARRSKPTSPFAAPQVIAELKLPDYVPHRERRQFWVTDDEQWLYYAEDPEASGNLFAVRLKDGPGRGVLVKGQPLQPEAPVVAKTEEPEEQDLAIKGDEPEAKPVVDPKSLPTPYAAVQQKLGELLAKRDIAAAAELVAKEQKNPELQTDRPLLDWDAAEVAKLQSLWQTVEAEVGKLKVGDAIRIGGAGFTFEGFTNGVLALKTKTKTVERKLTELSAGDLLAFADKSIPKTDAAGQLSIGIFLHYEGKAQAQASKTRLDRAGEPGVEFRDHLAVRRLKIIEQELARENLGAALKQIDELAAAFPGTASAKSAELHRAKIYDFVKWNVRGTRKWVEGEDASYGATDQKQPGSLLVSASDYDSFNLSLEWRITSPNGRGGVFFRYPGAGVPLDTAFKVQLANDAGVAPDKFCTGALFNYYPPSENAAKAGPLWSTLSMQVRGEQVVVTINGKKVMETIATDASVPLRGFVALDGEYGGIAYRKILLVEGVKPVPMPLKPDPKK